jgi:putative transposase
LTHDEKVKLIDKDNHDISLSRQAELLAISRSSLYYQRVPVSQEDIQTMNLIDQIYTKYPYYGSRRIKKELRRYHHVIINRKHIQRLMHLMGIEAIYPRPNTSRANIGNTTYPYLLKNLTIESPNQVWGTDITYIKLNEGFAYLVAIIDWFSRYVVTWALSNSLEIEFVLENLSKALKTATPQIHNSDQGSHFTSSKYTDILQTSDVQISMDGRGRCMDNIFTERLWRTVKYENVYIKSYNNVEEARRGLGEYFDSYNNHRLHSSLNDQTPSEVYFGSIN